jgi:chemotaxis protein CheX
MQQTIETKPPLIDARLVTPFVNAVRDVFQKMVGVPATIQKPFLKSPPTPSHSICGIIGFSGNITGSVVLSFSDSAAQKLVESFAGVKLDIGTADFADAIGELANMVAGAAKRNLGGLASISVPSVVIGKGFTVSNMSTVPCLVIPCTCPYGDFAVEVCIKKHGA